VIAVHLREEPPEFAAQGGVQWGGARFHHGHLMPHRPGDGARFEPDPSRADDHDLPGPPGQFRAQPVRVAHVAQVEQAVQIGARHVQPARRRPGGQQEPVIADPPPVGERDGRVVQVQRGRRGAQFQFHVMLGVPVAGHDGEILPGRGPREVALCQRRPLVGHLRFGADQDDPAVAAEVAQRLRGPGACHPTAHDQVCRTCHGPFLLLSARLREFRF
jgi:hypothetical protein